MKNSVAGLVCLVFIQFLSFLCALYVLIRCINKKNCLTNLPNHLIICLLMVATWAISIDLLSTEFYFWNYIVPIQTVWACRLYNISYFSTSGLNRMFMAFMSIERHFLVFRPQLYRIRRSRYILHYFPILMIIVWTFTYSIVTDVFLTCPEMNFRYTQFLCGYTCSILSRNPVMIYVWFQVFFPTMITIIACILLPIRFVIQKRNLQRLQWRRARKMIIQMSIIAGTYTLSWLPYTIIVQLASLNILPLTSYYISTFMIFAPYVTSLLIPFISLHIMSDWLKLDVIKRIIHYYFPRHQPIVRPQNTFVTQHRNHISNSAKMLAHKPAPLQVENINTT